MQYNTGNLPRLEYFHHQFDKINTRLTDIERRLNDINLKVENSKVMLQRLESGADLGLSSEHDSLKDVQGEVKEIKKLLSESQANQERTRKVRLPL